MERLLFHAAHQSMMYDAHGFGPADKAMFEQWENDFDRAVSAMRSLGCSPNYVAEQCEAARKLADRRINGD